MAFHDIVHIQDFLEEHVRDRRLTAWEFTRSTTTGIQEYRIFGQTECRREVNTEQVEIHLYQERLQNGTRVLGESAVTLNPEEDYRSRIRRCLEMAAFVANEPFALPESGGEPVEADIYDPVLADDPGEVMQEVHAVLERKSQSGRFRVSSSEVIIEEHEIAFRNSRGVEGRYRETEAYVECVLLCGDGTDGEAENVAIRKVRRKQDLDMAALVDQAESFVRDMLDARTPPTGLMDVVFSHDALDELFRYFVMQSSGPAAYHGWSRFRPGEPVVRDVRGDRLTLVSDPHLPGGMLSRPFDANGLATRRVEVIRDGVFSSRPVDSRHAAYLGLEASGPFANVVVQPGQAPLESLFEARPVLHCLQFSAFEPNPVTGAFSGEIRTGYYLTPEGRIPVKGGSVSGVMDSAFQHARFARETVQRESYLGPAAVRLGNLSVSGA